MTETLESTTSRPSESVLTIAEALAVHLGKKSVEIVDELHDVRLDMLLSPEYRHAANRANMDREYYAYGDMLVGYLLGLSEAATIARSLEITGLPNPE